MSVVKNFLRYRLGNLILRIKILILKLFFNKNNQKLFVIGVAKHGNFGDFAISEAQNIFLKDHFDLPVIEITEEEISNPLTFRRIEAMLGPKDIIFLQGGGNHGNMYSFHESYRREVIKRFKENRIVLFPQTYYFSDDEEGQLQKKISSEIFSAHNNLILAFRDKLSFKLACEAYPDNTVIFCPDMVLYLTGKFQKKRKNDTDIMILFRAGKEAKYQPDQKAPIIDILNQKYNIKFNNHTTQVKITQANRYSLIKNQVELYSESGVVLTDKLHGAIFSILTATPCVMLSTYNHKLKEVYKLFESVDGYYYAETLDEIPELIKKALKVSECNNPDFTAEYNNLYEKAVK